MKNEDVKGLDVKKGMALVGNSKVVYVKLLNSFVKNAFCDQVVSAVESGDSEQIRQKAHAFKGVAGNMHMNELYELAKTVETDAKEGRTPTPADENVARLVAANKTTLDSVNMILANPDILSTIE